MAENYTESYMHTPNILLWTRRIKDFAITFFLWTYFTLGFIMLFAPFYVLACFTGKHRQRKFQRLNSLFYRGFFSICRLMIPRTKWKIHPHIRAINSSIVMCNHISYIDSILLVSIFPRHTTIAKDRLFGIPLFGRMLTLSGYIPSKGRGRFAEQWIESVENIQTILKEGGNVIVFPEGTRSSDGRIGQFHKGVFKIAKYSKAPVKILKIKGSNQLFRPGKFAFNSCIDNTVSLEIIAELSPDYDSRVDTKPLMNQVHSLLSQHNH